MDSYRLTRGGYTLDIGSYLQADPGPNFDFGALFQSEYSEHPLIEGGQLAYEHSKVRHFRFPLTIASSGAFGGGLNGLTHLIRSLGKHGAHIDLQPDGIATSQAVRFNVLNGRLTETYRLPLQRISRRTMELELDVEPYGYWPTQIILASAASIGLPGILTVPNASIIGDIAGVGRLTVQPSSPAPHGAGSWYIDTLAWSLGALASFTAKVNGGSMTSPLTASVTGNPRAFGSQSLDIFPSPTQSGWTQMAHLAVPSLLEPSYRGRFRVFALARQAEPSAHPWQVSLDVVGGLQHDRAMGSAAPVATVPWDGAASSISPSPAYHLLDLGELTAPLTGSGADQTLRFRLWAKPATSNLGIASPHFSLGGLYLLPLEGGAGIMPRGIAQPSILTPSVGRFTLDAFTRAAQIAAVGSNLASPLTPLADAFAHYQGDLPRLVASTLQIDLLGAHRKAASGATAPLAYQGNAHAAVSLSYRPRFAFLKGV